jgi:DNA-binding transcriptional ArsR family regulator
MARKSLKINSPVERCSLVKSPKCQVARSREYAKWFKALADPTRIRILNLLATNQQPVCVRDIVKHFPVGQPTISHHLKLLRAVRFVLCERRGTSMLYRINRHCLAEFPRAARMIMNLS